MNRLVLVLVIMFACVGAFALDAGYVSPESYAVNEADLEAMYYQVMSQPSQENGAKKQKREKEQKYYLDDMERGIKAKLRQIRYNMQEPHHGQKHEIKLNSPYHQQKLLKENVDI